MQENSYFGKTENNSYHQELLVSHPMPEYVDELNTLVTKKKLQQPITDSN